MSKIWSLNEIEALSLEELELLIPDDIDQEFDKLPVLTKVLVLRDQKTSKLRTPCRIYTVRSGEIMLLNGDILLISDMQVGMTSIY